MLMPITERICITMTKHTPHTIDEMNRLLLPDQVRRQIGLSIGDTTTLSITGDTVVVRRLDNDLSSNPVLSKVSDLGVITIPTEMLKTLGWNTKDKITQYHSGNTIVLKKEDAN